MKTIKIKLLEYILYVKFVNQKMDSDECYLLKIHCKDLAESFFNK